MTFGWLIFYVDVVSRSAEKFGEFILKNQAVCLLKIKNPQRRKQDSEKDYQNTNKPKLNSL